MSWSALLLVMACVSMLCYQLSGQSAAIAFLGAGLLLAAFVAQRAER